MRELFSYFVFPGFLFAAAAGLMAGWVDRKVTARIHWRVGPPWHQNFTDILKLFGKETIVPQGSSATFLLAPYLGLLSAALVAVFLGKAIFMPQESFGGDIIVVLYLLAVPAISLIIGASASRNPLASVGASREIKLMLAYELPFLLCVIAIIIKSSGALRLGDFLGVQKIAQSHLFSPSGFLAFGVAIICMQAKLCQVPFDASEADQELMGGVLIEYSGLPLAIFKLTKAILLYSVPMLVVILFLGKDTGPLFLILKFVMLLVIIVLIKNTNPRLRIDQSMRFFWRIPSWAALASVVLALLGK